MLWDGRRVPFTLLGGYLGAGKTTIVNHLLRTARGRRLVVLVNDVGAVNVDATLIADHDGETLTLTNGCVCCGIADDFGRTLEQIRELPEPPDHVLMELSGVAEPARVAPWANTAGFRLDGIVVAADADQIAEHIGRAYVGDTIRAQLAAADVVLLTKPDLAADGGSSARRLIAATTSAPSLEVVSGVVDIEVVLGVVRDPSAPGDAPPGASDPEGHETSLLDIGDITTDELRGVVDGLGSDVVRAKGLVMCVDDAAPIEVQVVGRRRTIRRRPDLDRGRASGELVTISVPAS